jgi:hypothetical protein
MHLLCTCTAVQSCAIDVLHILVLTLALNLVVHSHIDEFVELMDKHFSAVEFNV